MYFIGYTPKLVQSGSLLIIRPVLLKVFKRKKMHACKLLFFFLIIDKI